MLACILQNKKQKQNLDAVGHPAISLFVCLFFLAYCISDNTYWDMLNIFLPC